MPISSGAGKTDAMHLTVASLRPAVPAPLQLAPGQFVQWTDIYKYLGYILRSDLADNDATSRLVKHKLTHTAIALTTKTMILANALC